MGFGIRRVAATPLGSYMVPRSARSEVFHDECIRAFMADAPSLKSGGVGCPVCFSKLVVDLGDNIDNSDAEKETPQRKKVKGEVKTPPKMARRWLH